MNLHEELADIKYIFCDKTGTLTQNELVFREMALMLTSDDKEALLLDAPNGDCTNVRGKLRRSGREDDDNVMHFFRCVTLNHDCIVVSCAHKGWDTCGVVDDCLCCSRSG